MTANIVDTIVRGVSCFCFHCEGLPGPDGFHIAAIQLLKDLGMIFLETAPFPRAPDPNPFAQLDATGNVYGGFIMATHSLLQPSVKAWNLEEYFECGYGGAVLDRSFKLGFGSLREDMPHYKSALQDMANGRREFLKLVIPHVAPRLAFADDAWNHGSVKDRHLADADLRRLFWTTYFGPCFVETLGSVARHKQVTARCGCGCNVHTAHLASATRPPHSKLHKPALPKFP